jgi:membrane fusion protein, heavy metal efflux system
MNKNISFAVLGLLIGGSALLFWNFRANEHEHREDEEDAFRHFVEMTSEKAFEHGITVDSAGPGVISQPVSARGKVIMHPDLVAHILPKVPGIAKEAFKNRGDVVAKGEILAVLDSREMADAKAEYLAAVEKQNLGSIFYEKENRLYEKHVTSEQEFLQAKSNLEESNINLNLARQHLYALGLNKTEVEMIPGQNDEEFRYYVLRSPLNGTVTRRDMTKGEYIEEKTAIYEIADLETVWVDMGIFPKDIRKIKQGTSVEVYCPITEQVAKGKLIYLSPVIEEGTIAAKAIAELENKDCQWRPGTFVQVQVESDRREAPIVVPKTAVQMIEGKPVVFLETPEGFQMQEVEIGLSDNKNMEVVRGLSVGDKYAATQTFLLKADLGKDSVEDD